MKKILIVLIGLFIGSTANAGQPPLSFFPKKLATRIKTLQEQPVDSSTLAKWKTLRTDMSADLKKRQELNPYMTAGHEFDKVDDAIALLEGESRSPYSLVPNTYRKKISDYLAKK